MSAITSYFIYSYLLLPFLALLLCIVALVVAKKTKFLKNKKMIAYILLTAIVLGIPGLLGFIDYWFMPYVYLGLIVLYLLLGWWNIKLLNYFEPKIKNDYPYIVTFLINLLMMFIGLAIFSVLFNLLNELQYGLWASTCVIVFIFPSLFYQTYVAYLYIPLEVYEIWKYQKQADLSTFESMDYNKLLIMELEFFKSITDPLPSKVKAKAPDNLPFGVWFQKFITDYNVKFPSTPIEIEYDKSGQKRESYAWIFYVKSSFFLPRRRVDFTKTILENRLKEKYTIIAKRVNEEVTESYTDKNKR